MKTKVCKKCGKYKYLKYFYKDSSRIDGYGYYCKKCSDIIQETWRKNNPEKQKQYWNKRYKNHKKEIYEQKKVRWAKNKKKRSLYQKEKQLKYEYNMTLEEYNARLKKQNGTCAICNKLSKHKKKKIYVDHDHKTGKVRGLLCHNCNVVLGLVYENITILQGCINYLKRNKK